MTKVENNVLEFTVLSKHERVLQLMRQAIALLEGEETPKQQARDEATEPH